MTRTALLLGWIKLFRAIRRHPVWSRLRPAHTKVALTVLLMVGHRPVRLPNGLALAAGEAATSHDRIAEESGPGITRDVVRRALKNLEAIGFLRVRRATTKRPETDQGSDHALTGLGIVVTVLNWERYQGGDGNGDHDLTAPRPRSDRDSPHKQEEKKKRSRYIGGDSEAAPVGAGATAAAAPLRPDVLIAYLRVFDREPPPADREILAGLDGYQAAAIEEAFRETREKGLEITFARAALRYSANGDGGPA